MTAKQMWMGIPTSHMQWVPQPLIDSSVTRSRHVETTKFENGGGDIYRSKPYQMVYNLELFGGAHDLEGIDAYNKFASGFYGDGLFHMAYPPTFETNLFPAHWASPGLIEQGWPNIYGGSSTIVNATPSFSDTASNSYNQPPRSATWSTVGQAPESFGFGPASVYIAIPEGYTLWLGWSGSLTGDATLQFRTLSASGSPGSPTDLTPISPTSSARLNTSTGGASVLIGISNKTSDTGGTITITSMMAQLWKTGITPTLTGNHVPGEGHTGLDFADDAAEETYAYLYPPKKGLSTSLIEVGAWR